MEYNFLMNKMMKYFLLSFILLFSAGVEARYVEYCTTLRGAVADVELLNEDLADKDISSKYSKITKLECFSEIISDELEVRMKSKVFHNGKELSVLVKYKGEDTAYRVQYYLTDIYEGNRFLIGNFYLIKETPISESEYQAAKENAKKKAEAEALR